MIGLIGMMAIRRCVFGAVLACLALSGCSRTSHEESGCYDHARIPARKELPTELNAYHRLTNAMAQAEPPSANLDLRNALRAAALFKTNLAEFAYSARRLAPGQSYDGRLRSNMTTVAECPVLAQWLDSRAGTFREIEAGLTLGRMQFPPMQMSNAWSVVRPSGFMDLMRLKLAAGRRLAESGAWREALAEFGELRAVGDMIASGDGILLTCGTRNALAEEGFLRGLHWMIANRKLDATSLSTVLAQVPEPGRTDAAYARACRAEAGLYTVSAMEALAREAVGTPQNMPIRFSKVFDPHATARLAQGFLARAETNAFKMWQERDAGVSSDLRKLVDESGLQLEVKDNFFWQLGVSSMFSDTDRSEYKRLWGALENAGKKQPNLLGILLVESSVKSADTTYKSTIRMRCRSSLLRAMLAVLIFRAETGTFPPRLEDAVQRGVIADVPVDFFSGDPVRYSPNRRLIWSVGADGVDDGGVEKKDMFVRLPKEGE